MRIQTDKNVRPIRDVVVVRELALSGDYKLPQDLFVPQTAGRWLPPQQGTVLAIGPDVRRVGKGAVVLYDPKAGQKHEGLDVLFLREADLISEIV